MNFLPDWCRPSRVQLAKRDLNPEPIKPSATLEQKCDAYLQNRHCTLWGQAFEIISPMGRAEAVAWLAEAVAGVLITEPKR